MGHIRRRYSLQPLIWLHAVSVGEVNAARAELALHRRARLPDPILTGGFKRQSDGLSGTFLGLTLPLPLFNRRSGHIQAVDARVSAAESRLAVAQRHIENDVRTTLERFTSLAARVELLRRRLLLGVDDLLDIARVSYAEGEMTLLELLDAADAFRAARVTATELLADYWVSYYDLERAAGGFPAAQQGSKTDGN
jgi:cobalt-zinc-cadmium efflux system outer membrane protein